MEDEGDSGSGMATATGTDGSMNGLSSTNAGPLEDGRVDDGVMTKDRAGVLGCGLGREVAGGKVDGRNGTEERKVEFVWT